VAGYLAKIGVTMELQTMDYPSSMSTMMKKTHTPGFFFSNGFGGPFNGIYKNFYTKFPWNPHMMSDPYVDKTHDEIVTNPNLTEKQAYEGIKKLAVYVIEQAPAIICRRLTITRPGGPGSKIIMGRDGRARRGPDRSMPVSGSIRS
jgi:ABC-type transport system substrate-binding protein